MGINTGLYRGRYIISEFGGYIAKDDMAPDTKKHSPLFVPSDDTKESRNQAMEDCKKRIDINKNESV